MTGTGQNAPTGSGGETSGSSGSSGSASTTTASTTTTTPTTPDAAEDPDAEQTIEDEMAMRKVRRRLRDRFGRRATRGGGAETVGTGYKLGG